jgi:hypothetical protein
VDVDPYVIEGITKSYGYFDSDATSFDTMNVSSITKQGTGLYSLQFTNAMNTSTYGITTSCEGNNRTANPESAERGSTGYIIETYDFDASSEDQPFTSLITGILA